MLQYGILINLLIWIVCLLDAHLYQLYFIFQIGILIMLLIWIMIAWYSPLLSAFDFSKIHKIKSLSYLTGNSKIVIKTITGKTIFI